MVLTPPGPETQKPESSFVLGTHPAWLERDLGGPGGARAV